MRWIVQLELLIPLGRVGLGRRYRRERRCSQLQDTSVLLGSCTTDRSINQSIDQSLDRSDVPSRSRSRSLEW